MELIIKCRYFMHVGMTNFYYLHLQFLQIKHISCDLKMA